MQKRKTATEAEGGSGGDDDDLVWIPRKQRKLAKYQEVEGTQQQRSGVEGDKGEDQDKFLSREQQQQQPQQSLLSETTALINKNGGLVMDEETRQKIEETEEMEKALDEYVPLKSRAELASGVTYTGPIETGWRPPRRIRALTPEQVQKMREKWYIQVSGEDIPPPVRRFEDMRLPKCLVEHLHNKGINRPTPIQMQGFPAALSGRDVIGIAYTGSGKTITFAIPMIIRSMCEELKLTISNNEGPIGLILCPSRELARQTYDVVNEFCDVLYRGGYPLLRNMLCIGGEEVHGQLQLLRNGVHNIIATPGRLVDFLGKRKVSLRLCQYLVMDEADRLIDLGFEEHIRTVIDSFEQRRQTLLFSATMPLKIQNFARSALVRPVEINVGRAGAVNLDVRQEVEWVKPEAKLAYLGEVLKKTPPPVLIFADNKSDVDEIHEHLLGLGVSAVAIYGAKDQAERDYAISAFKSGEKDVLIATDVASKGLDFHDIRHVINYDFPKEIDAYVHRIGRTGRCGKTGLATTFINRSVPETLLVDLKNLLAEAGQEVPEMLNDIGPATCPAAPAGDSADGVTAATAAGTKGCPYCSGMHSITECPKMKERLNQRRIEYLHNSHDKSTY